MVKVCKCSYNIKAAIGNRETSIINSSGNRNYDYYKYVTDDGFTIDVKSFLIAGLVIVVGMPAESTWKKK